MRPPYAIVTMYISILSPLLAVWIGKRSRNALWWYVLVSFLADASMQAIKLTDLNYKEFIVNIWYGLQLTLVGYYLLHEILRPKNRRLAVAIIFCVSIAYCASWSMIGLNVPSDIRAALLHGFLLLLSLAGLFQVIRNIEHVKIEDSALFIISSAFLLNSAGLLILDSFHDYFVQHINELNPFIWCLRNVVNILTNLAIAYVFYLDKKKAKSIGT